MATQLTLSTATVRTHVQSVLAKRELPAGGGRAHRADRAPARRAPELSGRTHDGSQAVAGGGANPAQWSMTARSPGCGFAARKISECG
jgi:hypothetical protein